MLTDVTVSGRSGRLLRKFPLRVLVQHVDDPKARALAGPGVELVQGDMEDIASLKRTFEMAGDELSMAQIAEAFGRMLGHEVKYVQLAWDEFAKRIDPAHFKMFQWFDKESYHVDISAVRMELAQVHTFERWLQSTWRAEVPAEPVASER